MRGGSGDTLVFARRPERYKRINRLVLIAFVAVNLLAVVAIFETM